MAVMTAAREKEMGGGTIFDGTNSFYHLTFGAESWVFVGVFADDWEGVILCFVWGDVVGCRDVDRLEHLIGGGDAREGGSGCRYGTCLCSLVM